MWLLFSQLCHRMYLPVITFTVILKRVSSVPATKLHKNSTNFGQHVFGNMMCFSTELLRYGECDEIVCTEYLEIFFKDHYILSYWLQVYILLIIKLFK